jgi:hypothetical protein
VRRQRPIPLPEHDSRPCYLDAVASTVQRFPPDDQVRGQQRGGSPGRRGSCRTRSRAGRKSHLCEDYTTDALLSSGTSITRRTVVLREVSLPKRSAKRTPPLPHLASPIEVICSLPPGRHPRPRLGQFWHALGKHFARTGRMTAKAFANGQRKLKLASDTRSVFLDDICQTGAISSSQVI